MLNEHFTIFAFKISTVIIMKNLNLFLKIIVVHPEYADFRIFVKSFLNVITRQKDKKNNLS